MDDIITYFGHVGNGNVGDESIFLANKLLFDGFDLIPRQTSLSDNIALFGGGTWVPPGINQYKRAMRHNIIATLGVGVRDPEFRNRKYSNIDLSYYLGNLGMNELLQNNIVRYLLKPLSKYSNRIITNDHYYNANQYRRMRKFDLISVRGPISKRILSEYSIDSTVVGDPALILEPSDYKTRDKNRIAVTLRQSGQKWAGDDNYIENILKFCRRYSEKFRFMFVPLSPTDIPLHHEASNLIKNSEFKDFCSQVDVRSVIDTYSNCEFVIGERLHASVLSACSYTPFISIEYRTKNADFANLLGMSEYNRRGENITNEWIENKVERTLKDDSVRTRLKREVNAKRREISDYSERIIETIE